MVKKIPTNYVLFNLPSYVLWRSVRLNVQRISVVRMAEWSKAPDSRVNLHWECSGPRMWAWVRIPLLTLRFFFFTFLLLCFNLFVFAFDNYFFIHPPTTNLNIFENGFWSGGDRNRSWHYSGIELFTVAPHWLQLSWRWETNSLYYFPDVEIYKEMFLRSIYDRVASSGICAFSCLSLCSDSVWHMEGL